MDIEIFPNRYLSADTTEKLLKDLDEIEGIIKMVLHGQRLPPAEMGHPDRKVISIKGQKIDLQVKTGRILMEIKEESIIDEIRNVCENHLQFGFNINNGTYIRKQKTVSDNLKYGKILDDLSDEIVGLTDQNAQLSERVKILKKK
ncbi:methyl-coenzyme M reductase operon protein D [Methanobrevibacter sp. TMH8]|uniref:methyl-coenzyme M reductase operon protein D n=1 Tax=Methanobrevibacter sp. TMH8 TaxID=2848611 RepID=UPI001CCCF948|nr:methyl-coenzyme M reductase operon protein D [Methanobrevibacter sp. TMH8]MBZ9570837.1 methyl-coenzyme M reductase operon protein D [Methanobrevibacter sp. TMH8]